MVGVVLCEEWDGREMEMRGAEMREMEMRELLQDS